MTEPTKKDLKLRKKLEKKQRKLEKKLRALQQELHALENPPKTAPKGKRKAVKRVAAKAKKKRPRAAEKAVSPSAMEPTAAADSDVDRDGEENYQTVR
jgi:transposase